MAIRGGDDTLRKGLNGNPKFHTSNTAGFFGCTAWRWARDAATSALIWWRVDASGIIKVGMEDPNLAVKKGLLKK